MEKDSLKRIAFKMISCYRQKIRPWDWQCANLLIVGAVAFSTYAKSYNRLFGYHGNLEATGRSATEDSRH